MYHACTEAHTCCGLQVDAFSFELSTHQLEEPMHVISPAFGTLRTDPMIRTRRQLVVLPQPGVGKFGTSGMNCSLGRTVLTEACMFRSPAILFFDAGGSLSCVFLLQNYEPVDHDSG